MNLKKGNDIIRKKKITRKEYQNLLKELTEKSKITKKIKKLYDLNKKDLERKNDNLLKIMCDDELILTAYGNLETNSGALSKGTDPNDTVDGFNKELVQKIKNDIRNGSYEWKDIKKVEIPKPGKKKKRPLGLPTFSDKIVQEMIRIILNAIYEPIFQKYEFSHGSRPKRSTHTAMFQIKSTGQGLDVAIEGDIKGAFPHTDHELLLNILKKKISDKKFLELIYKGLKHSIIFEGKKSLNKVGLPQGSIASPILFNIYMNEFDMKIKEIIEKKNKENAKENRRPYVVSKISRKYTMRIHRDQKKLKKVFESKPINFEEYKRLRDRIRINKQLQLKSPTKDKKKMNRRLIYCRYVDDWIILTNEKVEDAISLKEEISEWLRQELKLELDHDKTHITDLNKGKARFLGFTIFRHIKKVSRVPRENEQKSFKRRSNELVHIGIDHERVVERMINLQLLTKKKKIRHVGLYCSLKPWQIVEKFTQKLHGFANYYHPHLSYKSDLSYYYYVMKYSCVKTISYRMKKSISQIFKTYGQDLRIPATVTVSKKENKPLEKNFVSHFPKYMTLLDTIGIKTVLKRKSLAKEKEINFEDIYQEWKTTDEPVSIYEFQVNLRSGLKTYFYCTLCGTENQKNNPVEMHHLKHIRKGKVIGFSQIMKNLGRKRIPVCKNCHNRIHKGEYDGLALKDLFDPDFITI